MEDQIIYVMILGDNGVGKSAIVVQWIQKIFLKVHDVTLQDSYRKAIDNCMIDILDTGTSPIGEISINQTNVFILCYSLASRFSFESVKEDYIELIASNRQTKDFSMIIVGNKSDLEEERIISTSEGKELSEQNNATFLETSACTGENVDLLFQEVVSKYRETRLPSSRKKKKKFFFF